MQFYWVLWSVCGVFIGYGIVSLLMRIEKHLSVLTAYRILNDFHQQVDRGEADPITERTVREADEMLRKSIRLMVVKEDEND